MQMQLLACVFRNTLVVGKPLRKIVLRPEIFAHKETHVREEMEKKK